MKKVKRSLLIFMCVCMMGMLAACGRNTTTDDNLNGTTGNVNDVTGEEYYNDNAYNNSTGNVVDDTVNGVENGVNGVVDGVENAVDDVTGNTTTNNNAVNENKETTIKK